MDGPVVEQSSGKGVWESPYPHPKTLTLLGWGRGAWADWCPIQYSPALPAHTGGHGGPGWLEGPSGMGSGSTAMPIPAQWMCRWVWMHRIDQQDVALAFGSPQLLGSLRMRHMMVHLQQGVKCGCPSHVPSTSKNNSEDKNEGFLLITLEGGLPFCSDFWNGRV